MLLTQTAASIILALQGTGFEGGGGGGGIFAALFGLVWLALAVVMIAGCWKIFTKAGQPGWAAIIPIYNLVVLLQIVKRPVWWFVLMLIPFVNFVVAIIVSLDLAKVFGKSVGFAVGLIVIPIVFYPMLGFGDAQYQG